MNFTIQKLFFFYPANLDGIIVGLWAHKSTDEGIQLFNDESIDWIVNTIAMDFASLHQNLQESLNESNGNTGTNKNYQDNCWDSKNYPKEAQLNFFFLILALLRIICFWPQSTVYIEVIITHYITNYISSTIILCGPIEGTTLAFISPVGSLTHTIMLSQL